MVLLCRQLERLKNFLLLAYSEQLIGEPIPSKQNSGIPEQFVGFDFPKDSCDSY